MNGLSGNVLITGGAGFLGRAIIARAHAEGWPCSITVFSRDDHKHALMEREFPAVRFIRGDVAGDRDYLAAAMAGHETVIHAAANKHVDLSECNVEETIRSNVQGSINVLHAATRAGVKQLIGISTDKACHSVNVYGMTKALMERLFQSAGHHVVRYGNVLGSTGSMITDWRKKLEANPKQITTTSADMSRFWLSVEQAIDLILLALTEPAGTITIPKLPALSIGRMEAYFIPEDTEIVHPGFRPGEKRHEELLTVEESPYAESIHIGTGVQGPWSKWLESWYRLYPITGRPHSQGISLNGRPLFYSSNGDVYQLSRPEILSMIGEPA